MRNEADLDTYANAGFGQSAPRGLAPAVVVVDFSYGFTDTCYPTAADMSDEIAATRKLLDVARAAGRAVIFTTISYTPGEITMLPWLHKASGMKALMARTRLVEIDDRLAPSGASGFHGTNLAALLAGAGIDTVLIAGATTSGCVRATVVDAVQSGFNVLVPRDCVADRAQAPHEANLFDIQQKYGDVIGLDDALAYLQAPSRQGNKG